MKDYKTIIGVIQLRQNECAYLAIQNRFGIGSSTVTRIIKRFDDIGIPLNELKKMEPYEVEKLFYPPSNLKRKDIPDPDFQKYYDRIHAKGSRINIAYCWIEYKHENPDGYEQTQFYEYYRRFVEEHYGSKSIKMAVERVPGERMYIDWVGDQPELLTDPVTGELSKVHIFVTTLGVSSLIYAQIFMDEKLPRFIEGTVNAIQFYGGVAKYFVPDNLKTAVIKHTRDELILQSSYSDLEDFYGTIILPPPARKPKGKPSVENHVKYLETHLVEKLKEGIYTSLDELNEATKKIVAELNSKESKSKRYSRIEQFEKYDKPCLKPMPAGTYTVCDYKSVAKIPDNYHIEYDNHYYSVLYTQCGKPAILKATSSEIKICDRYNRLICTHKRIYSKFPLYITNDSHMRPDHLYYKEVNAKDGDYYRRWASVYGPNMSEFIDRLLKSSKHEEQSYNACAGILHFVKDMPHGLVEEAASQCIKMNSCRYKAFKAIMNRILNKGDSSSFEKLPDHENIRGKGFYK